MKINETFSLKQFGVRQSYGRLEKLGDRLEPINCLIDWEAFRPLIDRKHTGAGRPFYDSVLILKMLILQRFYSVSDEELEYQVTDRISFQKFLGFPNIIPDYSTVWLFREYLSESNLTDCIWNELKRQMEIKGITFAEGKVQDATFIVAPPEKTNSGKEDRGRGQPSTRNEDGSWTKKNDKSFFGYKNHIKTDLKTGIIEELAVTTASVHDSKIDLMSPEDIAYRDKGYFGAKTKARGDATMKKGVRGQKNLSPSDQLRNKRISRKRAPGERPFGVMKRVMRGGFTYLTELHRVFVQELIGCLTYNLLQMKRLLKGNYKVELA